ncbi:VanZ family protein [Planomicrobium soli]|nr:VanZ family protein [Planomicrobium soli]
MALIFFLSHQPSTDSSELSSGVVEVILMAAEKIAPELREHVDMVHHIVRKNAHFIIYLVLGVLVMNALKTSGVSRCRALIWAISICFVYAISDEFHQMFIPGRGPALMDVAIDSAGAAVGAGLYVMIAEFKAMKKQSKSWNEVF